MTAALVEALTPEEVGAVLVQHAMDDLAAQAGALAVRAEDGAGLRAGRAREDSRAAHIHMSADTMPLQSIVG